MTVLYPDTVFKRANGQLKKGHFMDYYLISNLEYLKKLIKHKWDGVGMLCGFPGSGKTTLSHQLCYFMDKTFNIDRVVFSGEELMRAIDTAKRGQAICFDEAVIAMMSQDFSTELQKILIKKFTMIRSKGLFILFIIPDFFLMRRYFSVNRTRFMIECYSPDGLSRGYAKFFSYNRKKKLFLMGYKDQNINAVKPNFQFRFVDTDNFFIDAKDYEEKKQNAIRDLTGDKKTKEKKLMEDYKDAKLKLKIQMQQWKEKMKLKNEEKWAKIQADMKEKTEKYKDKTIELSDKLKYEKKGKSSELEKQLGMVLYKFYMHEAERFKKERGEDLPVPKFLDLFQIPSLTSTKMKKYFEAGKTYYNILE